jgi:hypothetical protein
MPKLLNRKQLRRQQRKLKGFQRPISPTQVLSVFAKQNSASMKSNGVITALPCQLCTKLLSETTKLSCDGNKIEFYRYGRELKNGAQQGCLICSHILDLNSKEIDRVPIRHNKQHRFRIRPSFDASDKLKTTTDEFNQIHIEVFSSYRRRFGWGYLSRSKWDEGWDPGVVFRTFAASSDFARRRSDIIC